ncbi:ROK family protein [Chitinivibrio alkaliphilus]|uniref:Glucokinase n=1 Tax=Chitinivibrio alkaliphilus ACht1 TaxID=1313304 RepID=U7DC58_9BACT|nr:ROK family protein [Chitinivibrio alkaliphilus]ERP39163.1 glucokinase [Chitinivibrio alkaliphilus ACht1]
MKFALGIDIGGTNTVIGLVEYGGIVRDVRSIPTCGYASFAEYLENVRREAVALQQAHPRLEIVGVGIGAPDANHYTGVVESASNLEWECPVDLRQGFADALGYPVVVTNDANASAYGEMMYGAAKGVKNFVQITLGTGLGSGVIINGQILTGKTGFAGELGHSNLITGGRDCGCGRKGCVETYVSATGICRTVFELLSLRRGESSLRNISAEKLTAKDVYTAAVSGDPIALEAFDKTGDWLAQAMADVVVFLSPEMIVFFGGLTHSGEYLMAPFRKYYARYCMKNFHDTVVFTNSELKESDAAVLGAAGLVWNMILSS